MLNAHLLKWRPVLNVEHRMMFGRLDSVVSVGLIEIPRCRMDTSADLQTARNVVCILILAERVSVMNVETCIDSKKEMNQLGCAMNVRAHLKSVRVVKSVSQICLDNALTVTMLTVMFVMVSMKTVIVVLNIQNGSNSTQ